MYLGAVKVGDIASQTKGPVPVSTNSLFKRIAAYPCTGARDSNGASALTGQAAALAYGKKLAAAAS